MTLSDLGRKDGAPELRPRARLIYLLVALAFIGIMARLIFRSHGLLGLDGLEGTHLIGAGPDHAGSRLWHFIPCSGEVAEWFRNH